MQVRALQILRGSATVEGRYAIMASFAAAALIIVFFVFREGTKICLNSLLNKDIISWVYMQFGKEKSIADKNA